MTADAYIGPTLGASRVADAIGVGWDSPIRVFGELTRKPGFEPREDTETLALGRDLQAPIFRALQRRGLDVGEYLPIDPGFAIADDARPWLVGHPDGWLESDAGAVVVDAKARSWTYNENPTRVQLLVYMHLGGYAAGLAAILHNLTLDTWEVERNERYIETILHLADDFYGHVARDEWPAPVGHPDDVAALRTAFRGEPGSRVRESRGIRDARRELSALNAADGKHGARKRRKDALAARITAYMGDAVELLGHDDDTVARWTPTTSRRFDSKRHAAECPECHARYTTTTETRRLTLL